MDERTHLLIAARGGDRDALSELVHGLLPDVWRFCAAMVGPSDADDATQDTFLRVWRSATTFRAEASAKTWVLAIARRACLDLARRRPTDLHPQAPPDRPAPGDHTEVQALDDMISRLAPERRAAFVLTQVLGMSYDQTAEVCSCPVGTVRSRVARARADLFAANREDGQPDAHVQPG